MPKRLTKGDCALRPGVLAASTVLLVESRFMAWLGQSPLPKDGLSPVCMQFCISRFKRNLRIFKQKQLYPKSTCKFVCKLLCFFGCALGLLRLRRVRILNWIFFS